MGRGEEHVAKYQPTQVARKETAGKRRRVAREVCREEQAGPRVGLETHGIAVPKKRKMNVWGSVKGNHVSYGGS